MKNIKKFETTAEMDNAVLTEPYVLYNEETGLVYTNYTEKQQTKNLVITYNVTDISRETEILSNYGIGYFSSMVVDGVEMEIDCYHQFDTVGIHRIEFVHADEIFTIYVGDNTYDCYTYEVAGKWLRSWGMPIESIELPSTLKYIEKATLQTDAKVLIFNSNIEPIFDYNYEYPSRVMDLPETGILKYPKGSDYSNIIAFMAQNYPGWVCVEF